MDKEAIEAMTQYLDKVAEKIGTGTEHIWPWLVRQQYVEAVFSLALLIVVCCAIGVGFVLWRKITNSGVAEVLGVFLGIFAMVALVFCVINCLVEVPGIFNPEYHALMDILGKVK